MKPRSISPVSPEKQRLFAKLNLFPPEFKKAAQLMEAIQVLTPSSSSTQELKRTITGDEFKLLCSFNDEVLLQERRQRKPAPGSFAAQPQYCVAQTILTSKLECVAELLSNSKQEAATQELLLSLNSKLQSMLREYIDAWQRKDAFKSRSFAPVLGNSVDQS